MAYRNSRNYRNNPYILDGIAGRFHHSAAGALWRWRTEITLAASIAVLALQARHLLSACTGLAVLMVAAVVLVLPWPRRFLLARAWCVISRHRLQRLCFETRMHTRSGRLPLILRIHPTKVGERAHIWCRAGICLEDLEDFEAHKGEIRAACYARDARVTRNTRWSQLVTVDIIRHDPLGADHAVPSHLTRSRTQPQPDSEPAIPALHVSGQGSDAA